MNKRWVVGSKAGTELASSLKVNPDLSRNFGTNLGVQRTSNLLVLLNRRKFVNFQG